MLLLLMAGIALLIVGAVYAARHPRQKGEQVTSQRKLVAAIIALGTVCVLAYAVLVFVSGRGA